MKRKRIRTVDELANLLGSSGGSLDNLIDDPEADNRHDDDALAMIPEKAALPLGRPEGSNLSETERGLLQTVQQAFEGGVLNDLSPMQRGCFTDVIISGDTYTEVAKRYGICVGAVQTHVKRAAKRIRKAIGNLDE